MTLLPRRLSLAALGVVAAALIAASGAAAQPQASAPPAAATNAALDWNAFLLDLQAAPGVQPATVHPTYELALTQGAIADAVNAVEHNRPSLLVGIRSHAPASAAAAADAAARATLGRLYPAQRALVDQHYDQVIAAVPAGHRRDAGIRAGKRVAAGIAAVRGVDGSSATPPPFAAGTRPGDYQPTPPSLTPPVFTHWARVSPFLLRRGDQFRPGPPRALTSAAYAASLNAVKALGSATSTTRTPEQTQIGLFWNAPIWATWNRIADTAAQQAGHGLTDDAHALGLLDVTLADATISLYDAKYAYTRWRPITAIRAADTDGNPATDADPAWTPLSNTAPDPSYPGAHATLSAAAADVLTASYGGKLAFDVTSPTTPGVTRGFARFADAAAEASASRVYNGNHMPSDEDAGDALGHHVAAFALHVVRANR